MAGSRDWERELSRIDKLIDRLPEEEEDGSAPVDPRSMPPAAVPGAGAAPAPRPAGAGGAVSVESGPIARPSRWAVAGTWALSLVAGVAAVGVTLWPFGSRCGVELTLYMIALAGTAGVGLWTAVRSWKARAAWPHVIGIAVLVWTLGLGAWEVLPRVGAALPSLDRPAIWSCG